MKTNINKLKKWGLNPIVVIIVTLLITFFFFIQLRKIQIENDTTIFLPKENPKRVEFVGIENKFGGTMVMGIGLEFTNGYIYSINNINYIKKISEEIEKIEGINKVTSIINIDNIVGTEDSIVADKLIKKLPENQTEEEEVKQLLQSWEIYKNNIYSEDYKATVILVKLSLGSSNKVAENTYKKIKEIFKNNPNSNVKYYIAGLPAVLGIMSNSLRSDLARLIPVVVIILILTLFLSFKKLEGVILPTLTVGFSTIITVGLMAMLGFKLTMIGSAIPVLMIAVGSAYGIHILSHYFDEMKEHKDITYQKNIELVKISLKKCGIGVILAALTTFAGFISLATSQIVPLKEFGIFSGIGVLVALILSVTFIPSILVLKHNIKLLPLKKENKKDIIDFILEKFSQLVIKHKIFFYGLYIVVLIISIIGLSKIIVGNPMINYFKENTEIRQSDRFLNSKFNGTSYMNIVISGENSGDIANPEILQFTDNMKKTLKEKFKNEIGNVLSFADLIKKMNEAFNYGEKENFYEIPSIPEKYKLQTKEELKQLISQYLLLFSGGNLNEFVDDPLEPKEMKVDIILKTADFTKIREVEKFVYQYFKENAPDGYKITINGNSILQIVVTDLIVNSQILNIITALILIFLIVAIYYRSIIAGVFAVLTLIAPILINFGIMGFFKIRLDAGTSMVASLAIGIGIDYTIHFINAYHNMFKHHSEVNEITTLAIKESGKPIIFNAISVAFGFFVLVFSNFIPLKFFGLLVAITMITSSFAALTILPVLLQTFKPKFVQRF